MGSIAAASIHDPALSLTFEPGAGNEAAHALRRAARVTADGERHALAVDGGYAKVAVSDALSDAPALTIAFDFRAAAPVGSAPVPLFWSAGRYSVALTDKGFAVYVGDARGRMQRFDAAVPPGDRGDGDGWTRLALSLDAETGAVRFYVDGALALAREKANMGFDMQGASDFRFGGSHTKAAPFKGMVDDLRIYSEALDAGAVAAIGAPSDPAPASTPPVARPDAWVAAPATAMLLDVLANDSGDGLRIVSASAPAGGAATVEGGMLRYAPRPGFQGEDRFAYTAADASGATAQAEVAVTVGIVVTDAASLRAALTAATGGETILLAPGDYGRLSLDGRSAAWAQYAEEVTLRSLDPEAMASFSGMALHSARNLTFEGIKFDYVAAPEAVDWVAPFTMTAVSSVTIRDSVFDGDLLTSADPARAGFGTGQGLFVRDSANILVAGSEFFNWHRGAVFSGVLGLDVLENSVHSIRSDGFDFVAVKNVNIQDNHFFNFRASFETGDHADMIQFWTQGAKTPTTDVIIRNNVLDSGNGNWTQSIWMRNEEVDLGRAGEEMFYRNVVITDNVIRNAHLHGIAVGETVALVISGNTVAHSVATSNNGSVSVPQISVNGASRDVTITDNLVGAIAAPAGADWTVENNVLIQRTSSDAPGYYGDLFVDGLADHRPAAEALRTYPGATQAGAPSAVFDTTPEQPDAFIFSTALDGLARDAATFRIGGVFDAGGPVAPEGAKVTWSFGDGATSTEAAPVHRYAEAGIYAAEAAITLADGRTLTAQKTIATETPVAIMATFDNGFVDESDTPNPVRPSPGAMLDDSPWGSAARLGGGSDVIAFGRNAELIGNDAYTVMFDFQKDAPTAGGRLLMFPYSFNLSVGGDWVSAEITTNAQGGTIRQTVREVANTDWHHIALTFSGEDGVAALYLNGAPVGVLRGLDGATQKGSVSHDLNLGSPWGGSLDGSIDNFAFLRGALSADQIRASHASDRPASPSQLMEAFASDLPSLGFDGLW